MALLCQCAICPPFAGHTHDLDVTQNEVRATEVLESEHRSDDTFELASLTFSICFDFPLQTEPFDEHL